MTDSVASEFSTFLYLLIDSDGCRYFDDAKSLISYVKKASESDLGRNERRSRINGLSDFCRDLIRRLEADRNGNYQYRIPLAVREFSLSTLDHSAKLGLLGNFELAVRRFERPGSEVGRWPDKTTAA
ncbi:MAG: hypothetical protein WC551_02805 [Patescibacteria group bacterium]